MYMERGYGLKHGSRHCLMVVDSVFALCPESKVSPIFAQFLFAAMAGSRISLHVVCYSLGGLCVGQRAPVVPFLSVCSLGQEHVTSTQGYSELGFSILGKF